MAQSLPPTACSDLVSNARTGGNAAGRIFHGIEDDQHVLLAAITGKAEILPKLGPNVKQQFLCISGHEARTRQDSPRRKRQEAPRSCRERRWRWRPNCRQDVKLPTTLQQAQCHEPSRKIACIDPDTPSGIRRQCLDRRLADGKAQQSTLVLLHLVRSLVYSQQRRFPPLP